MITYIDYDFYKNTYKGSASDAEFETVILKSCAYVRRITFGRADDDPISEDVKLATCAVCDVFNDEKKQRADHNGMSIASESTDGYSVHYSQENKSANQKAYESAELYLSGTDMLCLEVDE